MTKTMTSPPAAKGCSKGPLYSRTVSLWRHDGRVPSGADRSGDFLELALEPIGLLLSTPMTVCPLVLGRHVPQQQFLDVLLGNEPVLTARGDILPAHTCKRPRGSQRTAEEYTKGRSLSEFFDEVAMPALARAQADTDRGALSPKATLGSKPPSN
jgi:hypothetical protein